MGAHAFELARVGFEAFASESADFLAERQVKTRRCIQSSAHRCPPLGQQAQARHARFDARDAVLDLLGKRAKCLALAHGHRIHQVGTADFKHLLPGVGFVTERITQMAQHRQQSTAQFQHSGQVHHRGEAVVGRL